MHNEIDVMEHENIFPTILVSMTFVLLIRFDVLVKGWGITEKTN